MLLSHLLLFSVSFRFLILLQWLEGGGGGGVLMTQLNTSGCCRHHSYIGRGHFDIDVGRFVSNLLSIQLIDYCMGFCECYIKTNNETPGLVGWFGWLLGEPTP